MADPLAMYLEDVYTVGVNLAGLPGMTVPAGFAEVEGKRLPVGVQLIAPAFDEPTMLRAARMFERETEFGEQAPAL
jgi:aspartyl-tRNA(Asn)/glutamyl-tRNA(Gln) amidotransferase subunit A